MNFAAFHNWLRAPDPCRRAGGGRHPLIMGVLNVTPDSFSDGGQFRDVDGAVAYAREMLEAGADLIDVGGESTRPGSSPVAPDEQVARVVPVVRGVAGLGLPVTISIDTTRAQVAEAALYAGAHIINDISAGQDDPAMLPLAAAARSPVILMHMQNTPATMQIAPRYADVTREVTRFLLARIDAAYAAGVALGNILVDPGIGFGKDLEHNLELLRRLREIAEGTGRPLVLGASRKGFIGRITGESDPARRLFGTAATVAWGIANGAAVLRVHDVRPMAQVARMIDAIVTS
jgi:dihydropteroate synthase